MNQNNEEFIESLLKDPVILNATPANNGYTLEQMLKEQLEWTKKENDTPSSTEEDN